MTAPTSRLAVLFHGGAHLSGRPFHGVLCGCSPVPDDHRTGLAGMTPRNPAGLRLVKCHTTSASETTRQQGGGPSLLAALPVLSARNLADTTSLQRQYHALTRHTRLCNLGLPRVFCQGRALGRRAAATGCRAAWMGPGAALSYASVGLAV